MPINKVVYGTSTLIDLTDSTLSSSAQLLSGVTAYDRTGTKLTGTYSGGSGDGYVWQDGNGYVHLSDEEGQHVTVDALTVSSSGVYTASTGHAYSPVTVPGGTAGTPSATKGTVSSHSVTITPSVTNSTGWITGSTITGTAVTVSASELVSGTLSITSSGTKDVTNYASASVASGSATASATKGAVSNHSVTVTPSVTTTAGYVTAGTSSGTAVTVSASELVSGSETKTENGTYDVTNLAELVVDVQSGGSATFAPKNDGKSHLYFNIQNESSKTVGFKVTGNSTDTIDWGDGTTYSGTGGTMTHTYTEIGMYEVVLSSGYRLQAFSSIGSIGFYYGSTLVAAEIAAESKTSSMFSEYTTSLQWIYYCNNTMTGTAEGFYNNYHDGERALQYCRLDPNLGYLGSYMFRYCQSLSSIEIPSSITSIPTYCFQYCRGLQAITIPSSVTNIGNSAFQYDVGIKEYHILPTTPPTLGTNVFYVTSGVKIYVPSSSLATYQTATNWSTYASYMVGE